MKHWVNTRRKNYRPRRRNGTDYAPISARYPDADDLQQAKRAGHLHRLIGATYPQDGSNGQRAIVERQPKRRLLGLAPDR